MSVLINWKICDNVKECSGIAICPTQALFWDKENKKMVIDNSKCTSCGLCEKECKVNAIHVVRTEEEYNKIRKDIDEDPRKISDLFVDRYGGMPLKVEMKYVLKEENFQGRILEATRDLAVVEIFNDSSIKCLDSCIPIKELLTGTDVIFRKFEMEKQEFFQKYSISKLPALLFFRKGKLIGKVEGFYNQDQKEELQKRIDEIIQNHST